MKKRKYQPVKGQIGKKQLYIVLNLLNTCFTMNKNVKKKAYYTEKVDCYCGGQSRCDRCYGDGYYDYTNVDYNMRDSMYSDKTSIIIECIILIGNFRLPIKYGKNDGIIYFEYCGKQVSFHDPKDIINCKSFKGEWIGKPNKKIPFTFIY